MSAGQLARNRAMSMGSGRSTGRQASLADFSMTTTSAERDLEPCDATASMFVYAQGSSIVVAHHDTLNIERRFTKHTEQVQLLAVDNVSERGTGRLVISYDAGQTAIVWDLMTGDEIARFASYTDLTVAAWMRNGNVAFGNGHGNVILFEPTTSEHISARTIDQIAITALAPAADCRTYAIGYKNGSILICILQPRFTILHNLSTSRAPSPIVTLAWHASSSKQKSDMLATQTLDGDLRVWSVSKATYSNEPAKVVRVLKRSGDFHDGPNWLAWSKGGRIIQYSNGETSSWDVRTKHVTYENVPTLDHVRGMANFGPGATLFTLGRNHTAQQFDLNSPPLMVANVQHPVNMLPPSPPVSIEEQKKGAAVKRADTTLSAIPINVDISESDEEHMSPLARIAREMDKLEERQQMPDRAGALSPASSQSSFMSRSSAASLPFGSRSMRSGGRSDHTIMSIGSSLHSRDQSIVSSRDSMSLSSMSTSSHRSRQRPSRLRQEVMRSPEEKLVVELFKFTKSRLNDIPHRMAQIPDGNSRPVVELRRSMLNTIFGWEGEADGLIRDELSRHPRGSPNSLLLTKWLGDIDTDIMATSSQSMTSSDWMLLALSGIGGQASQQKVARAYVQRLLEKGDVHTAATIMIGMGDQNDAVEIYVSHKRYMEALILVCYVYPNDWGRQTQLIRKWGEWAVQHSQQQLAIRCFSCTSSEPPEPYLSPPPQATVFAHRGFPELLSPPLSPPAPISPPVAPKSPPGVVPRGPQRNMARAAALKLVTSFGEKSSKAKFFGTEDIRTPHGAVGPTPIAESALSPHGGDQTAFLRGQRSAFATPTQRTATPGGFSRQRLPSIGEMPTDVTPLAKKVLQSQSGDSGSELSTGRSISSLSKHSGRSHRRRSSQPETIQIGSATLQATGPRSGNSSPMLQKQIHERVLNPLPSPSPDGFTAEKVTSRARNGSRDRKPAELQIQSGWPPMDSILTGDYMTTPELTSNSVRNPTPTTESVTGSMAGSISSTARHKRTRNVTSPVTGRSIDDYISSLEVAQYGQPKQVARTSSRDATEDRSGRARSSSRKARTREPSEDRGRSNARYMKPKRSPTSPVPMSPDELTSMSTAAWEEDQLETASNISGRRRKTRDTSSGTLKPSSKPSSRVRRQSPESARPVGESRPGSRPTTRVNSRRTSPEPRESRGRSKARNGSTKRSPSSPLPMSPQAKLYVADPEDDEDEADLRAAKADRERFRSRQRSNSRGVKERGTSSARNGSPDRRRRDGSRDGRRDERRDESRRDETRRGARAASHNRSASDLKAGDLHQIKLDRQQKKEAAARELEERRRSLARRPSAPSIVHPEQLSPATFSPIKENIPFKGSANNSPSQLPPRSQPMSPDGTRSPDGFQPSSAQVGLPATPRAMQHPKFDPDNKEIPEVPQIPDNYGQSPIGFSPITASSPFDIGPLPKTTFAPLPKTTYQSAPRHVPARSMSAPIPEEPAPHLLPPSLPTHPAFHAALPSSNRRVGVDERGPTPTSRKASADPHGSSHENRNIAMGGIDETIEADNPINLSNNANLMPPPPPPPPAPPILKELQHLASPPPPPPPPLYRIVRSTNNNANNVVAHPKPSGIEIVMDDEVGTLAPATKRNSPPQVSPPMPPLPPPNRRSPPHAQASEQHPARGHSRGRSQNDNSLSGRISRATERIRSASRGASPTLSRTKSPIVPQSLSPAPYESIPPTARWVADQIQNRGQYLARPAQEVTVERHPRDIKAQMMEGGMI